MHIYTMVHSPVSAPKTSYKYSLHVSPAQTPAIVFSPVSLPFHSVTPGTGNTVACHHRTLTTPSLRLGPHHRLSDTVWDICTKPHLLPPPTTQSPGSSLYHGKPAPHTASACISYSISISLHYSAFSGHAMHFISLCLHVSFLFSLSLSLHLISLHFLHATHGRTFPFQTYHLSVLCFFRTLSASLHTVSLLPTCLTFQGAHCWTQTLLGLDLDSLFLCSCASLWHPPPPHCHTSLPAFLLFIFCKLCISLWDLLSSSPVYFSVHICIHTHSLPPLTATHGTGMCISASLS